VDVVFGTHNRRRGCGLLHPSVLPHPVDRIAGTATAGIWSYACSGGTVHELDQSSAEDHMHQSLPAQEVKNSVPNAPFITVDPILK
jgi:hypothetical protein